MRTVVAIDLLFAVSLALTVMTSAGLVLRPHQRKLVDAKLEIVTLWLDYRRPIDWLRQQSFRGQFNKLLLLGIVQLGVVCVVILNRLDYNRFVAGAFTASENASVVLTVLIASVVMWSLIILILRLIPLKWGFWIVVIGSMPSVGFLWRILSTYHISLASLVSYAEKGRLTCTFSPEFSRLICGESPWTLGGFLVSFALLILAEAALVLALLSEAVIGAILIAGVLFAAEFTLSIARSIMWRVVEYEKGAFAALLVLATMLLGILKLYLT